ncbi:MAG: tripartite tricarboxylate transporter substrate binding protein [Burkholderiales bacterium]|nr:tripartite tricarboxylate transporter substrate binding protein [Burkholderiales bacterium]
MLHRFRRVVSGCVLAAAAISTHSAQAQAPEAFPSKPLRLVVPFPPGGGTDILARIVGQQMTEAMGQPAVVDNRGGAGGMIGTEYAMKAAPDGHTILIAVTAYAINPTLYRKVNYDPLRDFIPVTLGISFPYLFVVHPSLPVASVKDLIALAKKQPGKITFASSGTGMSNHLAGELFKDMAGIDILHVPYKGGGPAMNDILGGQVSMIFGTVLQTLPQVRAGKLRALAVSSAARASFVPELPTVAEAGLPEFQATGWYAFMVPAGTPAPVVGKLNRELTRILELPAVKQKLLAMGAEPWPTSAEKAREFIAAEVARWSRVVTKAGLKGSE